MTWAGRWAGPCASWLGPEGGLARWRGSLGRTRKLAVARAPPLSVLGLADRSLSLRVPGSAHSPGSAAAEQGFTAPRVLPCPPRAGSDLTQRHETWQFCPVTELFSSDKIHGSYCFSLFFHVFISFHR